MPLRSLATPLLAVAVPLLVAAGGAKLHDRAGPPFSPEEALRTFRVEQGFRIELVAAEPLVSDPVAMEIDENGRMYVVEMHGYPLDVSGSGRIMLLSDTDGDGRMDRSTPFADGLLLPTGIMRWKKGVLVTDPPEVLYLEDSDGDGRADIRRTVLTGFKLSNPQHNTNTPVYGLDNWIYLANEGPIRSIRYQGIFGDQGRTVRFPDAPGSPTLPPNADGRNVRFRPDSHELEALAARSQFGQAFDAWGRHFLVTNNRHIYHEVVAARYLARNPHLLVPSVVQHLPDYGNPAAVFPITENPEFQMLTDVGIMTSASGLTLYQGDLFPARFQNAAFVGESVHNLVHVSSIREEGASFRASRTLEGREFLASTDSWFRPVNFYVGPDGALYVVDYYRKIVEHPEWLDDATASSGELYAGRDRGRIWRIVPEDAPAPARLDRIGLGSASTAELVRTLEHPNLWWRRHAQRLLVDRKPAQAVAPLARLAVESPSAVGRVHALWTLQGLGRLDGPVIERALRDGEPGVRENAVKLAEIHLQRLPALGGSLFRMAGDPSPRVRFQLLLALGELDTPEARSVRLAMLMRDVEDEWMQIAGLSAARWNPAELFSAAAARLTAAETPGRRALFTRLGAMVGAERQSGETRRLVRTALQGVGPLDAWWRTATLQGLVSGVRGRDPADAVGDAERALLLDALFQGDAPPLRQAALQLLEVVGLPAEGASPALGRAMRLAQDRGADAALRADAVRLLALHDAAAHAEVLKRAVEPHEPAPVQMAAVRALGQVEGEAIAEFLVRRWSGWSPAVREEAVRALTREPGRVRLLLAAVEEGRVRPSEIDRPMRIGLMMLEDEGPRNRARALFHEAPPSASEAVDRYREALSLRGDPEAGRAVFARACAACHQYQGSGGTAFGPDLGQVRNRLPRALIADIVSPNQSIADGYESWRVELTDGSTISGIIAGETPTSITLRHPWGTETTIPRTEISSLTMVALSAMPEGLDSGIGQEEMAHLVAYLKGVGR